MLGDGKCMSVGFYGDLDLDLHCEQDVRVTLTNVAGVPGLAFDTMYFNRMQERHEIILNRAGASMLVGRVRFKKFRAGSFIQATRVPHDDARRQASAVQHERERLPQLPRQRKPQSPVRDRQADGHQPNRDSGVLRRLCRGEGDQAYCSQGRRLLPQVLASLSAYLHGPGRWVPEIHRRCKVPHELLDDYTNSGGPCSWGTRAALPLFALSGHGTPPSSSSWAFTVR